MEKSQIKQVLYWNKKKHLSLSFFDYKWKGSLLKIRIRYKKDEYEGR